MEYIINPDGTPAETGEEPASQGESAATAPAAAPGDVVTESNTERFMADVIEASMQTPVIVDFWAPWCGPCKQLGPAIEKLVRQTGGLVKLVNINIDENQQLAQQMRIQSIPAVYAFKSGQPVDGFVGALPESQIRAFIDRLIGDAEKPLDAAVEQAATALAAGDTATAQAIYGEIISQDPTNPKAIAGMIRCATAAGDTAQTTELIDSLTNELKKDADVAAAISAFELAEETSEPGDVAALRDKVAADENDHQARFDLAMALYGGGDSENAINELVDLVKRDRTWNDEAARKQLVKIFDALGPTHPLTVEGRKQLSVILFS